MMTEDDESMREVLYDGACATLADDVEDLISLVNMRNDYARKL